MPDWLQPFAEYNPFTIVVDAVRALFVGAPAGNDVWGAVVWCFGIIAVFGPFVGLAVPARRRALARPRRLSPATSLHGDTWSRTLAYVEPSEEIRRVVDRWTKAISEGDADSALGAAVGAPRNTLDRHRSRRVVAWRGDTGRLGASDRGAGHVSRSPWTRSRPGRKGPSGGRASKETDQLWRGRASMRARRTSFTSSAASGRSCRCTGRCPQANDEVLGRALTVTLEELEQTIQREQPDLSSIARRRRHGHDRLHRHRRLDRSCSAGSVTWPGSRSSVATTRDRRGHGGARRHGRRDSGRRIDARVLERAPGGRMRASDPARDGTRLRRATHRRSASGSASTPATPSRRPTTSSARRCTTRRASPARRSEARCSSPASCTISSRGVRASTSSRAARSS